MLNWFRDKTNKSKNSSERSLDGTYKIKWVQYHPTKQRFTAQELHMENTKLTLSGNNFDIISPIERGEHSGYVMHEKGTFSLMKSENNQELITLYVDGDEVFATGVVYRAYYYTQIYKFIIVDRHYRLQDYRFEFRHENGEE